MQFRDTQQCYVYLVENNGTRRKKTCQEHLALNASTVTVHILSNKQRSNVVYPPNTDAFHSVIILPKYEIKLLLSSAYMQDKIKFRKQLRYIIRVK